MKKAPPCGGAWKRVTCRAGCPLDRRRHSVPFRRPCPTFLPFPALRRRSPCRPLPLWLPWPAWPSLRSDPCPCLCLSMGFARLINSGHLTKFISAAQVAHTGTHIFVSRDLPAWSVQHHGVLGLRGMWTFDMIEKLERDAGHLRVD